MGNMDIQGVSFKSFGSYVNSDACPRSLEQEDKGKVACCDSFVSSQPEEGVLPLRILHLNDLHGATEPEDGLGGLAKTAQLIKEERQEAQGEVLTFNTGDLAEGTMVSYVTKGKVVTEAMASIGFDAVEPGNHDFAWGQATLSDMLTDIKAPVLNANITDVGGNNWGTPYQIKDFNGVKVGMIGLTVDNMSRYVEDEKLEGLQFRQCADTLREYLPMMKKEGADVLILLSHIGFEEDCELARQFPELDLIVGGHSHTALQEGHREGNTLIVQSGAKGQYVGEADLDIDLASKKVIQAQERLLPVTGDIQADLEVAKIVETYTEQAEKIGSQVMGQAEETLTYSHTEAAKVNQIYADSILEATGADIAVVGARNPRAHIGKGEVTFEDLFNALPHTEDVVVKIKCPGSLLKEELELRVQDGARGPATPAGFTYAYDPKLPSGNRVTDIRLSDGSPLELDKEYTVGTTLAMARKGKLKAASERELMGSPQEAFMDYFSQGGSWHNDPDARLRKL